MHLRRFQITAVIGLVAVLAESGHLTAQAPQRPAAAPSADPFGGLQFRNIGPASMGGRIDDLAVLESNPAVFYAGTASGGLWKTTNMGTTWEVLFDDLEDAISIGDIAIAPEDANTVWVGTGENNNRQSGSWGNGIYKSIDGGQTWKHMGLRDSRHIARIIVDPVDHDVIYVAALGSLYGPGKERGVYKSTDGGLTWTNVLFVDQDTGATELVQDPSNNKVLYAATYQRRRATWGFNGGGPGSAMWKSSDAGRTWTKLTKGIPPGHLGRIGMDVYRANPNIVYARIEPLRPIGASDGRTPGPEHGDGLEGPRPFVEFAVQPERAVAARAIGVLLQDCREAIGLWVGQRSKEDRVDGAEDGRGSADADGKREHGDRREPARVGEAAGAVAKIREQRAGGVLPAVTAHLFADGRRTAELQPCGAPGRLGRQPAGDEAIRGLIEEMLHFVDDVAIGGRPVGEDPQAARELPPEGHTLSPRLSGAAQWPMPGASSRRFQRRAVSGPPG